MVRSGWRRLRSLRPRAGPMGPALAAVPGLWATRDPGHEAWQNVNFNNDPHLSTRVTTRSTSKVSTESTDYEYLILSNE